MAPSNDARSEGYCGPVPAGTEPFGLERYARGSRSELPAPRAGLTGMTALPSDQRKVGIEGDACCVKVWIEERIWRGAVSVEEN